MQAMEELAVLHASATEVHVRTAEKLGAHDATTYKLGRLLITSVSLKDSGLRGGKGLALEGQSEYVPDPEVVEEMKGLGLPVAFGTNKAPSKANHQHPKKKQEKSGLSGSAATSTRGHASAAVEAIPGAPSGLPSDTGGSLEASGTSGTEAANQPADIFQDPAILQAAVRRPPQQPGGSQQGAPHPDPHQPHQPHHPHGHAHHPHQPHHHQQQQLPAQVQQQAHPHSQPHPQPHPQAQPQLPPDLHSNGLVQAVHFLNAFGFNLPLVWHAMGIPMTPASCTPADVWAAAQVAGAPPDLVHRALAAAHQPPAVAQGPGPSPAPGQGQGPAAAATAGPMSCAALEQRLTSLNLDETSLQQQQGTGQQQGQGQVPVTQVQPQVHMHAHHASEAGPGPRQVPMHVHTGTEGLVRMDSPWQQELDPSTGCFYYFNVGAQITQWEVPQEGFRPKMMSVAVVEQGLAQQQLHAGPQQHPHHNAHHHHHHHHGHAPQEQQQQQQQHTQAQQQQQQQQQQHEPQKPTNGRHGHNKGSSGSNGKHAAQPNPNHTWQQLELLQRGTDSPDGYASPCPEGEEQERVEVDQATAAYVRSILPRNMAKYWLQRYSLFSKYDDGIQMDTEGWYSVTPEVLALHQATMCKRYGNGHIVADAMAGCGGNVIQMAMVFPQVLGVEISPRRCNMAEHNVSRYGVTQRVNMLCADFFGVAPTLLADAIFVSPPWGGPTYQYCETFDVLSSTIDGQRSVAELLEVCLGVVTRTWGKAGATQSTVEPAQSGHTGQGKPDGMLTRAGAGTGVVCLFLPRNTDLLQLETLVPQGSVWMVERDFVNGKLKGVTVYCF